MDGVVDAVNLLRHGPSAWNAGRAEVGHDLTHVEIRNANLAGAQLDHVDFDGSQLISVDLTGASLAGARLNGVEMDRVRLDAARLCDAELKGAVLDRCCLRQARLDGVEAYDARIKRSDLTGASICRARLVGGHIYNCNLSDVDWRDLVPDGVPFKRIVASAELLAHLRAHGCRVDLENQPLLEGLPDWDTIAVPDPDEPPAFILYGGRTYWFAVDRWDFFISHATADKEAFARPLAEALQAAGERVWLDAGEVKANDQLEEVIEYGVRAANFGVAILSPRYFGREWTERELDLLDRKRVFLVLHDGFTRHDLPASRPSLQSRVTLDSSAGAENVARALIDATSRPPGEF